MSSTKDYNAAMTLAPKLECQADTTERRWTIPTLAKNRSIEIVSEADGWRIEIGSEVVDLDREEADALAAAIRKAVKQPLTAEQRSAIALKAHASRTPEQRRAAALKAQQTLRAKREAAAEAEVPKPAPTPIKAMAKARKREPASKPSTRVANPTTRASKPAKAGEQSR
jgi:hypothetical protein